MFTQKQQMAGECTHTEYWQQFVSPAAVRSVKQRFGKRLLECDTNHFNGVISLPEKDNAAATLAQLFPLRQWQDLEGKKGWRPSQSEYVCFVCAAMVMAREELRQPEEPANFIRTVRLGRGSRGNIFCQISVYPHEKHGHTTLSITGVEGPTPDGNAVGGCGQIDGSVREDLEHNKITFAPGWDAEKVGRFLTIWDKYHLNDLTAGSPRQEAAIAAAVDKPSGYEATCAFLDQQGLLVDAEYIHDDKPYKYGTAWLVTPIPADVTQWLFERPETDVQPAWV